MNKCVNKCVRTWCISFPSPQLPEAAHLVSSPARRQVPRLGAGTHLLGRTPRAAASPLPPWPPDGASLAPALAPHPPGLLLPMDPRPRRAARSRTPVRWPRPRAAAANGDGWVGPPREPRPRAIELGASSPRPQRRQLLVSCVTDWWDCQLLLGTAAGAAQWRSIDTPHRVKASLWAWRPPNQLLGHLVAPVLRPLF